MFSRLFVSLFSAFASWALVAYSVLNSWFEHVYANVFLQSLQAVYVITTVILHLFYLVVRRDDRFDLVSYGYVCGVHLDIVSFEIQGATLTLDRVVRAGTSLTKIEDESRADEHLEEHNERDAYIRVELLKKRTNEQMRREHDGVCRDETTYGDALPQTHDDGADDEIPDIHGRREFDRCHDALGYSHEEVAETVARQYGHERVHPQNIVIGGFSVTFDVLDKYACGQEKEKGFETKEWNEEVHKVGIDTGECAELLSGDNVGDRWMSRRHD